MKITLPEHIGEITLGQYQKYIALDSELLEFDKKKNAVSIFCNSSLEVVEKFPAKEIESFDLQIQKALTQTVEFQSKFEMNGIKFGFHPNLNEMNGAEWSELSKYKEEVSNYHRFMAILFRPILKEDKNGNYSIIEYNGTSKFCEVMRSMPLSIAEGSRVFFLNLTKELEAYILKFTIREQSRASKL